MVDCFMVIKETSESQREDENPFNYNPRPTLLTFRGKQYYLKCRKDIYSLVERKGDDFLMIRIPQKRSIPRV